MKRQHAYAGKVALRKAIHLARECGIEPAGFELAPDGTIRIMTANAKPQGDSLFDQLQREGKL